MKMQKIKISNKFEIQTRTFQNQKSELKNCIKPTKMQIFNLWRFNAFQSFKIHIFTHRKSPHMHTRTRKKLVAG